MLYFGNKDFEMCVREREREREREGGRGRKCDVKCNTVIRFRLRAGAVGSRKGGGVGWAARSELRKW